jgi:deoxyribonuclease V
MRSGVIACIDALYRDDNATVALVIFDEWSSDRASMLLMRKLTGAQPYEPGKFYKRELPCALAVLREVDLPLDAILIDGYVWLDQANEEPGFGAHLFKALDERIPVIGVAKSLYRESAAVKVLRGKSTRPLYVTAAGMDPLVAAEHVKGMHGRYRIPTLLKVADEATRQPY